MAVLSGGTYRVPAIAPTANQTFKGDGTTTAFATTAPAFGTANAWAAVAGVATAATFTQGAGGLLTATFASAPASGATVQVGYDVGAGLNNAAGAMASLLGLTSGTGTVYSGTVGGVAMTTAHQNVDDLATVLFAWGTARVIADRWAGTVPTGYAVSVTNVRGAPGDHVEIDWVLQTA